MKNKIKVMNRPQLSDEEIRSHMDFEKLVAHHRHALRARNTTRIRIIAGIGIFAALLFASWFVINEKARSVAEPSTTSTDRENVEPLRTIAADSLEASDSASEVRKTDQQSAVTPSRKLSTPPQPKVNQREEAKKDTTTQGTPAKHIVPVYTQAEPVDGYQHLYQYFARELTYPVKMIPDSVAGVVSVAFTINISGRPEKITIEQSLGAAFDDEAIRLVEGMPDWKPATYGDKPVVSRLSIPITFQINKIK